MRKHSLLILAFTLFASVPAFAAHYSDFYVIPVASHTPGQNGTMWMSDVAIQNFQAVSLQVEILVVESGDVAGNDISPVMNAQVPLGSASIPAGGSVLLKDILSGHRGQNSIIGALLIGGDRPFAVTSRNYSMAPSGDTVGQTVPPARDFLENVINTTDLSTATAYLPGLIMNSRFRTNLGMVVANSASSGAPLNVVISVRDAAGALVGERNFQFAPGALMHVQFSIRNVAPSAAFDIGSATYRITSGTGSVVPYASVIDNVTADAVFVAGVFPVSTTPNAQGLSKSIFRQMFDGYTRSVTK